MPSTLPNGARNIRFPTEPQRALLTPSASPSVGPPDRPIPKRPRLRSTPSSSISTTPSTSNESTSSADVNSARRASTLRVLNVWAQLAERYNKRLDEDDIVDLYSGAIIKDRGVVKGASRDYHIGHLTQVDGEQDYPDADQDQEDSEQDDDDGELGVLPPSETNTDDDAPISKTELLRGVPPLSATTDAEDLREFLEAEKKRRELAGDEEDEDDMSPGQLAALRKVLEERTQQKAASAEQTQEASTENHSEGDVDAPPTCVTRVPPSDDESEDELAVWTHDESTAVHPVVRDEAEQDVREVEYEIIELTETETDSDEEFAAILTHPPSFARTSPTPVPQPRKEAEQSLQSPPDSERGESKSRLRSHSRKPSITEATSESGNRTRSPLVIRNPEIIIPRKKKTSISRKSGHSISEDGKSDHQVLGRISPTYKGKGKEILPLVEDGPREKIAKPYEAGSRGQKRKRIASASDGPLAQFPAEPKSILRGHRRSISPSSITTPQPDGPRSTSGRDVSTPARLEHTVAGPSCSTSLYAPASDTQQPTFSTPSYRSLESESVQLTTRDYSSTRDLPPDTPIPFSSPYSQRHPSHPPSIFSSHKQGTPGTPHPGHPPPLLDPVQAHQAHYLLAQAMHHLSYLLSTTMPVYPAYTPNSDQSWHPPPLPPHTAYSTPIQHPPRSHHTPSSASRSGLPPSSPVRSSVSPPVEDQRARSRGRSRPRGRRVSFKLDREEVSSRDIQPEFRHIVHKTHKQTSEATRDKGKGIAVQELDRNTSLRLEGQTSLPCDVSRGRTPGPPKQKKIDVPRGRSFSRR